MASLPVFDASVLIVHHGLAERRDRGGDDWGVSWELKDPRSDSFPVHHPLTEPEDVDDHFFHSSEVAAMVEEAKSASS